MLGVPEQEDPSVRNFFLDGLAECSHRITEIRSRPSKPHSCAVDDSSVAFADRQPSRSCDPLRGPIVVPWFDALHRRATYYFIVDIGK
jgi:hypothetical protein